MKQRTLSLLLVIAAAGALAAGCAAAPAVPAPAPATAAPAAATAVAPTAIPATAIPPTAITATAAPSTAVPAQLTTDTATFEGAALKGNLLGDPAVRSLAVLLPPGYATSGKRYPVLYFLHGRGPEPTTGQLVIPEVEAALKQGLQAGGLQDMIVVFPNASNKLHLGVYVGSPAVGDVESYLSQDVVNYVDSHYRTLPQAASRGVAGCSMGGDGALHMGLTRPDVYGVAVPMSGLYYWDTLGPIMDGGPEGYTAEPKTIQDFDKMPVWTTQTVIAFAASAAPDKANAAWGFDMPYVIKNGKAEVAPGFLDKMKAADPRSDVDRYLAQPGRLAALRLEAGTNDELNDIAVPRQLDKLLTGKGVPHEYAETDAHHCSPDMYPPMLKFVSDHLAGEGGKK